MQRSSHNPAFFKLYELFFGKQGIFNKVQYNAQYIMLKTPQSE